MEGVYTWEEEYKRSWDIIQEDESGSLASIVKSLQRDLRRRRVLKQDQAASVQRGIIRHLFIILDVSKAMSSQDLKPSCIELSLLYLEHVRESTEQRLRLHYSRNGVLFYTCLLNLDNTSSYTCPVQLISEFFDQNPISQLGIIITKDGLATKLTELSGNPADHIRALKKPLLKDCQGEPSLQNALSMAHQSLLHLPNYGSREVLLLMGSLTTCDPGDIYDTIQELEQDRVRVSAIGLASEMHVLKVLTKRTGGTFVVPMNEQHYRECLWENVAPPPVVADKATRNLLIMGFPARVEGHVDKWSLCACHCKPTKSGFVCPRCQAKVCELPTECTVCGLTLVSSPHLARSYHFLFPIPPFRIVSVEDMKSPVCFSCQFPFDEVDSRSNTPVAKNTDTSSPRGHAVTLRSPATPMTPKVKDTGRYACPKCKEHFCFECDMWIHETLHNCPGCQSVA